MLSALHRAARRADRGRAARPAADHRLRPADRGPVRSPRLWHPGPGATARWTATDPGLHRGGAPGLTKDSPRALPPPARSPRSRWRWPARALLAPASAARPARPCPTPLCGGRVVAEPEQSVTFHQFDGPLESVGASLEAIEAIAPRYLEVMTMAEATGDPDAHELRRAPAVGRAASPTRRRRASGKAQVAASLSVHGLEAAGREGGAALRRGPRALERRRARPPALRRRHRHARSPRSCAGPRRGSASPTPTAGPPATSTPTPPAARASSAATTTAARTSTATSPPSAGTTAPAAAASPSPSRRRAPGRRWSSRCPNLKTSTDIHGELTTPNDAFSDLIIPAGQWTPKRQDQVNQLSLEHDPHRRAQVRGGGRRPRRRLRPAPGRRRHPAPAGQRRRVVRHRRLRRLRLHGRLVQPDAGLGPHGRRELPVATSRRTTPSSRSSSRRTSRPSAATSRRPSSSRCSPTPSTPSADLRPRRLRRRPAAHQLRPGRRRTASPAPARPSSRARRRCRTTSAGSTTSPC